MSSHDLNFILRASPGTAQEEHRKRHSVAADGRVSPQELNGLPSSPLRETQLGLLRPKTGKGERGSKPQTACAASLLIVDEAVGTPLCLPHSGPIARVLPALGRLRKKVWSFLDPFSALVCNGGFGFAQRISKNVFEIAK